MRKGEKSTIQCGLSTSSKLTRLHLVCEGSRPTLAIATLLTIVSLLSIALLAVIGLVAPLLPI